MQMNIKLDNIGKKISIQDLLNLENLIGFKLPEQFRSFYLRNNGGEPEADHFPAYNEFDPICVSSFLSVKYSYGSENNIEETYNKGVEKNYLPSDLLPFAIDWGGNYICINNLGEIYFYTTDTWMEELTNQENENRNKRLICDSFNVFVSSLVDEDEAYD